jgi:hypothetical protein
MVGFFKGDTYGMPTTRETNRNEVTKQMLVNAREKLSELQDWLGDVDKALERAITEDDGSSFPILYASEVMQKALSFYNEVARCNGAALVCVIRSSKKRKSARR